MHIGQQRGSAEGDLVDPYVFTGSVQSISVPHGRTSHLQASFNSNEIQSSDLSQTKFVTGNATGRKKESQIIARPCQEL